MIVPVDLTVASIAAGGDGVARTEGLVVFMPRTAPGDVIRARLTSRGRFARGVIETVLSPSADRAEPKCEHYVVDKCGGCQLQHLRYEAQLAAKGAIIADAISRIARRPTPPVEVRRSPRAWRYRRKLTLTMRRTNGAWYAGLRPYDDPDHVFSLRDCPITDERVLAVWREVMGASELLPAAHELRGAVRLADGGASFALEGGLAWRAHEAFFGAVPSVSSLWWKPAGGARRLVGDRRAAVGPDASFAQVNPAVASELHTHVVGRARSYTPARVVDAYAGAGDAAAALASPDTAVTAIELDPEAAAWCAGRLPPGSRAIAARVEDALPNALPADVVLLNPPRSGIDARVASVLERADPAPSAVIYVSCDPATLARDLARMPRFRIVDLVAFDMFPQTAHVEAVCELVPAT